MGEVIDQDRRQREDEMIREKAAKENVIRMNVYAKQVKEMNLPKLIADSGNSPLA
jgi:hypothetical protein